MTKEEIGLVLKQLRTACGMTQKEVADKIGRNQPIIGHWETGYAQPDANTLFILCDIYGTTVDEAFGFSPKNSVSKFEFSMIEKYRSLDSIGKETIDIVLDRESIRSKEIKEKQEYIMELEALSQEENQRNTKTRLINYYYRLASAGTGQIIFDTPPTKRIEIPDIPKYKHVDYAIGVNGVSMEPTYNDNDTLLVEMTDEVDKGEIGIFFVDNNCYVKKRGDKELISLNPNSPNVPMDQSARCMGRVIDKLSQDN